MRSKTLWIATLASVAAIGLASVSVAQAPPAATQGAQNIKRIPLQKFDVPGTDRETVTAVAEIVPDVLIGRHSHFGPESGYVLDGEVTLMIDGGETKVLKAGDSYYIPAGAIHDAKSGPKGAKVLAIYVVEKGKPLATPAPPK